MLAQWDRSQRVSTRSLHRATVGSAQLASALVLLLADSTLAVPFLRSLTATEHPPKWPSGWPRGPRAAHCWGLRVCRGCANCQSPSEAIPVSSRREPAGGSRGIPALPQPPCSERDAPSSTFQTSRGRFPCGREKVHKELCQVSLRLPLLLLQALLLAGKTGLGGRL